MTERYGNLFVRAHSDLWVGLTFIALGCVGAWFASGFDTLSRSYPTVLSVSLVALGGTLIVKASHQEPDSVPFRVSAHAAFVATLTLVAWIAALTAGLGYLLPTFAMQVVFLLICGVRDYRKLGLIAAAITIVSYLAFIVGLGIRLPAAISPWIM
ncbi:tripartite tricarboxylate transporter TctB family protein [Devosia sp.]|uniref:tripartite tricarboxylate transporter TctB family protein n=1 Tax=Devosia sp. TaxID=1871048 RepID=UPI002733C16E|nr:tripartite tricarboxylate transporter TctB family protein [Devosia sp.]MDP2779713.1 tripartite tricarboxylate transporter TctB family protein [Devosia sp.]